VTSAGVALLQAEELNLGLDAVENVETHGDWKGLDVCYAGFDRGSWLLSRGAGLGGYECCGLLRRQPRRWAVVRRVVQRRSGSNGGGRGQYRPAGDLIVLKECLAGQLAVC
jgi:hypothetical protein